MAKLMADYEMTHMVSIAVLDISIEKYRRFIAWKKENEKKTAAEYHLGAETCALCYVFVDRTKEVACRLCPYFQYYGYECDDIFNDAHWAKFDQNPTVENAQGMLDALQSIKNAMEDSDE